MLYKQELFNNLSNEIGRCLFVTSKNTAVSVLLIWDAIKNSFYEKEIGLLVDKINNNLVKEDFYVKLEEDMSDRLKKLLNTRNYYIFVAFCFDYYFSRIPSLSNHTINYGGKKRRLSEDEIELIAKKSILHFNNWKQEIGLNYKISNNFVMFKRKPILRRDWMKYDDMLYDFTIIQDALMRTFPDIREINNVNSFTTHVLESCFPMYWDSFKARFIESALWHSNLGWFYGDKRKPLLTK